MQYQCKICVATGSERGELLCTNNAACSLINVYTKHTETACSALLRSTVVCVLANFSNICNILLQLSPVQPQQLNITCMHTAD
jgi:hypothetical protein